MKSKILGLLAVGLLAGPMVAQSANVIVGGREWRQLTETIGVSWRDVEIFCNPVTGACSGGIPLLSFDGWTWASNTDIQGLFQALIPPAENFPTPTSNFNVIGSEHIAAALAPGMFLPTFDFETEEGIWGVSRSSFLDANGFVRAYTPYLLNNFDPTLLDSAVLDITVGGRNTDGTRGVWLFRTVPEPGTLALLGLGLAGLGLSRRRKA